MKSVEVKGAKRAALGKKETKKLRAEKLVPCVLYGGNEPIHFQASASEFRPMIYTPDVYMIDLNIDGTTCSVSPGGRTNLTCGFFENN